MNEQACMLSDTIATIDGKVVLEDIVLPGLKIAITLIEILLGKK